MRGERGLVYLVCDHPALEEVEFSIGLATLLFWFSGWTPKSDSGFYCSCYSCLLASPTKLSSDKKAKNPVIIQFPEVDICLSKVWSAGTRWSEHSFFDALFLSYLAFSCCNKAPWPRQLTEGRVYLILRFQRVKSPLLSWWGSMQDGSAYFKS